MRVEGQAISRGPTPRHEPRFEVRLAAFVHCEAAALSVHLLDLSRGGALADGRCPLATGTRVKLCCGRLEVWAHVAWVRAGRFGLSFEAQIRATDLFFQLGQSRKAA